MTPCVNSALELRTPNTVAGSGLTVHVTLGKMQCKLKFSQLLFSQKLTCSKHL